MFESRERDVSKELDDDDDDDDAAPDARESAAVLYDTVVEEVFFIVVVAGKRDDEDEDDGEVARSGVGEIEEERGGVRLFERFGMVDREDLEEAAGMVEAAMSRRGAVETYNWELEREVGPGCGGENTEDANDRSAEDVI